MPKLTPVENDPFSGQPKLVPVEGDPFAKDKKAGNPHVEGLKGAAEVLATLGSGAVIEPIAGLAGLAQGVRSAGEPDVTGKMADRVRALQEYVYSPRSEIGRAILSALSVPFEGLGRVAESAGRGAQDIGGGAVGGAAAETAVNMLPALLGARGIRPALAERGVARQALADMESGAARQGIDVNASGTIQRQQLADAGVRGTGGQAGQGEPFVDIRQRILEQQALEKAGVDEKFTQARATNAAIPAQEARALPSRVRGVIQENGFDVESMPILSRRLSELDRLEKLPEGSAVKLSAIDAYRRRLGRNRAAATDPSQNLALDTIRREMDGFMDEAFDSDMIRGDPKALQAWKDARSAFSSYKARFKDDKLIRKFAEQEATPEEMRRWVFGASSVGAKAEAARAVKSIGGIVGKDSPQFTALRQDALFDIMEPLLKPEPSLQAFAKNYDRLVRTNPSLVKELFPDSGKGLRELRVIAAAVERRAPDVSMVDINRMGAVALFGHGISRAALKVNLASAAISRMRKAGAKSEKRKIMGEVLGYDPDAPILPKRLVPLGAAGPAVTGEIERQ